MKINAAGLALIKAFEGCNLAAYKCPAGIYTIGYGHTGPSVKAGQVITQHQADVILESDLEIFEHGVTRAIVGFEMTPNQFSALVSFAFNVGVAAFARSHLRLLVISGDIAGAANEFKRWVRGGGKVLPGLVRRRLAEKTLFLAP